MDPHDLDADTTQDSPSGAPEKLPWKTWWSRVTRRQDHRDDAADARVDGAWREALQAAKESAGSAWKIVRFQWLVIALLVVAVIGLAGYSVGLTIPGFGEAKIGGAP